MNAGSATLVLRLDTPGSGSGEWGDGTSGDESSNTLPLGSPGGSAHLVVADYGADTRWHIVTAYDDTAGGYVSYGDLA